MNVTALTPRAETARRDLGCGCFWRYYSPLGCAEMNDARHSYQLGVRSDPLGRDNRPVVAPVTCSAPVRLLTLGQQFVRETGWLAAGDHPPGLSDVARAEMFEHVLKIIARATPLPAKTHKERLTKALMLRWLVQQAAEPGPMQNLAVSLCRDLGVEE